MLKKIEKLFSKYFYIFILLFSGLILLYFHTHGFPTDDEGKILQLTSRFIDGDLPYKDFQFVYTPGVIYANSLGYLIFGKSVLASRLIAFANSMFSVIILALIAGKLKFSKFQTFLLTTLYILWGPAHVNFIWPIVFNLTFALVAIYLELKRSSTNHRLVDFCTGAALALNIIFKQNLGLALGGAFFFYLIFTGKIKNIKRILANLFGFTAIIAIQLLYFWKTSSLSWFIKDFYYLTYQKIFAEGVLTSHYPWEYGGSLLYKTVKTIFYLSPVFFTLPIIFRPFKKKKKYTLIFFTVIFYYILSIRPTTDYVHLAPLIALSSLPLLIIFNKPKERGKLMLTVFIIFLITFAGYSATFKNYYRWYKPLIKQNEYFKNPRGRIWIDPDLNKQIDTVSNYYKTNAYEEKYTFVYSYDPFLYFILDKQNPTKYNDLHPGYLNDEISSEIIKTLDEKSLKHIVIQTDVAKDKSSIGLYLDKNYFHALELEEWEILQIKKP